METQAPMHVNLVQPLHGSVGHEGCRVGLKHRKVAVIGLGLMGSSICLALRRAGIFERIVGADSNPDHLEFARRSGAIDEAFKCPREAVAEANLVIVCTPIASILMVVSDIAPALGSGVILTEVGSVKAALINEIRTVLPPHVYYISSHPMAGTAGSGPGAGAEVLFDGTTCILVHDGDAEPEVVEHLASVWQACGCKVSILSPDVHDRRIAAQSNLPHIIAFTLAEILWETYAISGANMHESAGPSFQSVTRVARSLPDMWVELFIRNREHTANAAKIFAERVESFADDIAAGDRVAIEKRIKAANQFMRLTGF